MDEAQKYFDLSIKIGGDVFLDDNRKKVISLFEKEMMRIKKESK